VYEFGDNKAVGILKSGKNPVKIDQELQILNQIDKLGLPTVNAQRIVVDGKPAILMDRFAQGSKTIVRNNPRKPGILEGADTSLLNERSISDLKSIRATLIEKQVKIDDLQFLIGNNGKVVIADPLKVTTGVKPSPVNLRTIDKLIEAASKR
jgi:filamentous hemagglutinin